MTAPIDLLGSAIPWPTFRWYRGQKHYSGVYWSATMCDHVIHESRLELARLFFADFDPSVHRIVAQPFLVKSVVPARGSARTASRTAAAVSSSLGVWAGPLPADLPEQSIKSLLPSDIMQEYFTTDPDSPLAKRAAERPGFMAPPRAVSAAVAGTVALHVLEQPDAHQAGQRMRDLVEAMRDELWQVSVTNIDSWGRGLSPVLNAVHPGSTRSPAAAR